MAKTQRTEIPQPASVLVGIRAAAAHLGFGRTKLRQLLDDGEIPSALFRGERMMRRADLDAYVEKTFAAQRKA